MLARGESANRTLPCSVHSLRRCHPRAEIVVIDANDDPTLDPTTLPHGCQVLHARPPEDQVAAAVGRGTAKHVFCWRHSPDLLARLDFPPGTFDVHLDCDLLWLRPMDLDALVPALRRGRIAMVVDRATIEWVPRMAQLATRASIFPESGARGPMLNGGLLFRNPRDDGGLLERFWSLATDAAESGVLGELPWDDMTLLSLLLGQGGPCWERLICLGHDWNFITDSHGHPDVFATIAHYGGSWQAKEEMIRFAPRLHPDVAGRFDLAQREPDVVRVGYGRPGLAGELGYDGLPTRIRGRVRRDSLSLHPPFSATWRIRPGSEAIAFTAGFVDSARNGRVRLFAYLDGRHVRTDDIREDTSLRVRCRGADCITLVGVTDDADWCHFVLQELRWEH